MLVIAKFFLKVMSLLIKKRQQAPMILIKKII